jgi:hypothetical protein
MQGKALSKDRSPGGIWENIPLGKLEDRLLTARLRFEAKMNLPQIRQRRMLLKGTSFPLLQPLAEPALKIDGKVRWLAMFMFDLNIGEDLRGNR